MLLQGNAVRKASAAPSLRIDALRREYERTRSEMESQAHKAAKLEKKCSILIAGLQQRDSKLRTQVEEVAQQVSYDGLVHAQQVATTASGCSSMGRKLATVGTVLVMFVSPVSPHTAKGSRDHLGFLVRRQASLLYAAYR